MPSPLFATLVLFSPVSCLVCLGLSLQDVCHPCSAVSRQFRELNVHTMHREKSHKKPLCHFLFSATVPGCYFSSLDLCTVSSQHPLSKIVQHEDARTCKGKRRGQIHTTRVCRHALIDCHLLAIDKTGSSRSSTVQLAARFRLIKKGNTLKIDFCFNEPLFACILVHC